jgi:deazaflavin-dependent oxidoreductase (nitroreductase family)
MKDSTVRGLSRLHAFLMRASRGRLGRRLAHKDMLLLTTTGRKSGQSHTVPLLYLRDGSRLVVFASFGGRPYHPAWYLNILSEPRASVLVDGDSTLVHATIADETGHSIWWPRAVAAYSGYADYQRKTSRKIPIVFLDPMQAGQGTS